MIKKKDKDIFISLNLLKNTIKKEDEEEDEEEEEEEEDEDEEEERGESPRVKGKF